MARKILEGMVPSEVFSVEMPLLEDKFKNQLLDPDLFTALSRQADPWTLSEVPDMKMVVQRSEKQLEAKEPARHNELLAKAQAASLELLQVELKTDQMEIDKYNAAKAEADTNWAREACSVGLVAVCVMSALMYVHVINFDVFGNFNLSHDGTCSPAVIENAGCRVGSACMSNCEHVHVSVPPCVPEVIKHKEARYNRGVSAVTEFMAKRCAFVDIPDPKHFAREVASTRRVLETTPVDQETHVLFVVDLGIDHTGPLIGCLKHMCDVLNMSGTFALYLQYSQPHSNLKYEAKLRNERQIEDLLLAAGMNMEHEGSFHAKIDAEHQRDSRKLCTRYRVVVASQFAADSPWLQSHASRGNGGESQLLRVRDMAVPASLLKQKLTATRLSPRDRVVQRGVEAVQFTLEALCSALSPDTKLAVIQLQPGEFAEFAHAAVAVMVKKSLLHIAYKGIYLNKALEHDPDSAILEHYPVDSKPIVPSDMLPIHAVILEGLLANWWEKQPEAHQADAVAASDFAIVKPSLTICAWQGDIPVVAQSAMDKFAVGTSAHAVWEALIVDHTNRYGLADGAGGHDKNSVGGDAPRTGAGPDFSVPPLPRTRTVWKPEGIETAPECLAWAVSKKPDIPSVMIDKEYSIWIMLEPVEGMSNEVDCTVEPCELFGFGIGKFVLGDRDPSHLLSFTVMQDVDEVVMVDAASKRKKLEVLAMALFRFALEDGIPDIGLQCHEITRSTGVLQRFSVVPSAQTYSFQPTAVEKGLLKSQELGASFKGAEGASLCMEHAKLVWELEFDKIPPASLNLLKPKFWLLDPTNMRRGIHYKLL